MCSGAPYSLVMGKPAGIHKPRFKHLNYLSLFYVTTMNTICPFLGPFLFVIPCSWNSFKVVLDSWSRTNLDRVQSYRAHIDSDPEWWLLYNKKERIINTGGVGQWKFVCDKKNYNPSSWTHKNPPSPMSALKKINTLPPELMILYIQIQFNGFHENNLFMTFIKKKIQVMHSKKNYSPPPSGLRKTFLWSWQLYYKGLAI